MLLHLCDGRRNLVNTLRPEPLKVFEPECTHIFPIVGPRNGHVFKVLASKVKVTQTFSSAGILNDSLLLAST